MCTKFVVFTGKLADYIDCPVEKENDTYLTITRSPKTHKKVVESGLQVHKTLEANKVLSKQVQGTPEKPLHSASSMIMARIQRDLNSPSAAARLKALRAMKSPTKSAYSHFDIPEAEQSLHIPEPPSLQEIMRNIVVYVEVRSGEDNRSAGVRKVIEALGARVNLSLNRDTTHVVFKEGLMSTFKKAKQMNVPIVSILWIEACKNQRRICDPKDYPISNLDRYENPELYTKMKRVKCMQPDSECNKRVRAKAGGTPKDTSPTQKTPGNLKKTSTLIGGTPTSSKNKKKTDISQFFKKLEKPTSTDGGVNGSTITPESPATQLLNRIHSECYTPLTEFKKKTATEENNNLQDYNEESRDGSDNSPNVQVGVKKALNFMQEDTNFITTRGRRNSMLVQQKSIVEASSPLPTKRQSTRRHSVTSSCEIETTTNSLNTMAISVTPSKSTRRRSSLHTLKDMSIIAETPSKVYNIEPILEETNEPDNEQIELPPKSVTKRRTLYAAKTMDQTELLKSETKTKSTRRRTLYACQTMETSEIKEVVNKQLTNVSVRRRTCYSHKSLEQTEIAETTEAANMPHKKSVVNSKSLELTNEVEMNTPSTAKANKPSNRRRTLYGGQNIDITNSPNITASSSICVTPTSFQTGKVASSTLLEDSDNRSKLVATPPADAITGKLLEETEQCATPLVFSSTRQPINKRRTLFDVSMDIITQRLQCINQSARRSLAPPTPSADVINTLEKPINTPIDIKNSGNFQSSTESLNECTNSNESLALGVTPEANILKKKRKLFMPNDMMVTPPPAAIATNRAAVEASEDSDKLVTPISISASSNSVTKRRRTLMPISQPPPTTNVTLKDSTTSTSSTPSARKRRSTLDFEQIKNIKTKTINTTKESSSAASSTNSQNSQERIKAKKPAVLVYTNMHQQQIDVIREAVNKLGVFTLESSVTDTTTHLVSLEPRRTLNLLRALTRGLWILEYSWILDSLKAGKWMLEEPHELRDFSRAIEICRSERQAFGNSYKCDLFHKFGAFYISSQCCPISKENMRELITLCGGRIVNARQKARYIIGDANRNLEDKFYLTPYWVLDSITQMQLMKVNKYMYPLPYGRSASQPLPLNRNT
ncbi:microcephalin isoform X2 [Calliphora vicina]|uniref:microcephalin isoform X2 n=1 Tax=Calliphora vicina TaxID=7373 RepID=UPI00325C1A62